MNLVKWDIFRELEDAKVTIRDGMFNVILPKSEKTKAINITVS